MKRVATNYLIMQFTVKQWKIGEIVCDLNLLKKDEFKKIMKQQSKLTFNGIHKSYEDCDGNVFRKNEVVMDRPISFGFAVLEISKLHMYKT